ncbi:hypothetical protein AB4059_15630 [Lysobacter sp. 2RAF19]
MPEVADPGTDPDPFALLSLRVGHEHDRLVRVLKVYLRVTVIDVIALEHAAAVANWKAVRRLAERITEGCRVIEEPAAAAVFASILGATSDLEIRTAFFFDYSVRAPELLALLERVSDFLTSDRVPEDP